MPPKPRSKSTKSKKTVPATSASSSGKLTSTTIAKSSSSSRKTALDRQFGISDDGEEEYDGEDDVLEASRPNGSSANKKSATKVNKSKSRPTKSTKATSKTRRQQPDLEAEEEPEEDDDGFVFTRASRPQQQKTTTRPKPSTTTSKKSKKLQQREPTPPPSPKQPKSSKAKTTRKRTVKESTFQFDDEDDEGSSHYNNTGGAAVETPFPAKRLRTNEPIHNTSKYNNTTTTMMTTNDRNNENSATPTASQTIALPVSDTPVIRKNQELRRKSGVRRSSLSNRGKRVSSIGNGFVAVPHDDVDPKEFYKHSAPDIPEPHRMRQILMWCSKRMLDRQLQEQRVENSRKKPNTEEVTAQKIAQVIKEELVRDLGDGKITTSWWTRPEEDGESTSYNRVKKPNSNNVINEQNLKAFQQKLMDLEKEKQAWLAKLQSLNELSGSLGAPSSLGSSSVEKTLEETRQGLDSVTKMVQDTTKECSKKLEPSVDKLYEAVHRIKSVSESSKMFRESRMAGLSKIISTKKLDTADDNHSNPSTRDVLRALSRLQ